MAWPRRCSQIGRGAHNIYSSYGNFFDCPAVESSAHCQSEPANIGRVPGCASSAQSSRLWLLKAVISECARRNIDCTILRVGKPGPDDASSNYPVQWIQTFDETVAAINSHDVVVSSDSLPGHIAEYFQVLVFVFTPFRKDYWMPGSTFLRGGFGLFDDPGSLGVGWTNLMIRRQLDERAQAFPCAGRSPGFGRADDRPASLPSRCSTRQTRELAGTRWFRDGVWTFSLSSRASLLPASCCGLGTPIPFSSISICEECCAFFRCISHS